MADREFEIALWGATGYTGRLVAGRLAADATLRWALAGRDRVRLERVREQLAAEAPHLRDLPILLGDATDDPASLAEITARTQVVCTTVGPYARYGSHLVAACVAAGTHYCDLTGELPWIRRMIDAHAEAARAGGVRIVHCCGFDSIPSDLGVWMLHDAARQRGRRLARVDALFGESSGGFSGGTFASLLGVLEEAQRDPAVQRLLDDPYALDPTPHRGGPDGPDARGVSWEPRVGRWTAPFLMAAINTRVVRRSNAVAGYPYGRDFRYAERMTLPAGVLGLPGALAVAGGTALTGVATRWPVLRHALVRWAPKPGEGPTPEQRARGHFTLRLLASCDDGSTLRGRVGDKRDPGYGSTAVMLSESALCLARDPLSTPGGVLTPASAMGGALLARLRAAWMTWVLEDAG